MEESKKATKKAVKNPTQKVVEKKVKTLDDKIVDLVNAGFNVNQIGSMLATHTTYIKEVIAKNEDL